AEESRDRGARRWCPAEELHDHLDDRPVRDPVSVRQTVPANDGRIDAVEELRREPRLADTGGAEDREERACTLGHASFPGAFEKRPFACATDERGIVSTLDAGLARHRAQPVR